MGRVQRDGARSLTAGEAESLGKAASRLSDTSGLSLTQAAIRTLEGQNLNAEQIRRCVEQCNINAVNSKFASLRGDRIVHIDGGPADPVAVIDALNASKSAPGAHLHALEYSAPPAEKRAYVAPCADTPPADLRKLATRLRAAHEELLDMRAAAEMRMDDAFEALQKSAMQSSWDGASLADLSAAWLAVDPAMAKVAMSQLRASIPWGEKRAGLAIAPDHGVMRSFRSFAALAHEFHKVASACRTIEVELAKVARFQDTTLS